MVNVRLSALRGSHFCRSEKFSLHPSYNCNKGDNCHNPRHKRKPRYLPFPYSHPRHRSYKHPAPSNPVSPRRPEPVSPLWANRYNPRPKSRTSGRNILRLRSHPECPAFPTPPRSIKRRVVLLIQMAMLDKRRRNSPGRRMPDNAVIILPSVVQPCLDPLGYKPISSKSSISPLANEYPS